MFTGWFQNKRVLANLGCFLPAGLSIHTAQALAAPPHQTAARRYPFQFLTQKIISKAKHLTVAIDLRSSSNFANLLILNFVIIYQ